MPVGFFSTSICQVGTVVISFGLTQHFPFTLVYTKKIIICYVCHNVKTIGKYYTSYTIIKQKYISSIKIKMEAGRGGSHL